jgi:hypothetical protein
MRPRLKATWVRVSMAAAMSTSDELVSNCPVLEYFDGRNPGATIDVYNTQVGRDDSEDSSGSSGSGSGSGSSGSSGSDGEGFVLSLTEGQVVWCRWDSKRGRYFAFLGGGGLSWCPSQTVTTQLFDEMTENDLPVFVRPIVVDGSSGSSGSSGLSDSSGNPLYVTDGSGRIIGCLGIAPTTPVCDCDVDPDSSSGSGSS